MSKYRYFVAYSHHQGFGDAEIITTYKLDCHENLQKVREELQTHNKMKQIVILNFVLLREESEGDE